MSFNRLLLAIILVVCLVSEVKSQGSSDVVTPTGESTPRHHGLLDFVMKPIKAITEQARRLLGHRIESASDQMDNIRLQTFKIFMRLYNKTYSPEEIPKRMALFFERRRWIEESQRMYDEGLAMFSMRENEFTDWDEDELKKLAGVSLPSPQEFTLEELEPNERSETNELKIDSDVNSSQQNEIPVVARIAPDANSNSLYQDFASNEDEDESKMLVAQERVPASKDWRTSGCVSAPINQLKCGACYAIATMSVVESMRCINHVSSPILSPQHIVDCATARAGYQNYGCDGGWPTRVLKYLQDTGVAAREKCYPFVHRQNSCRIRTVKETNGCTVSASFSGSKIQYKVLKNERDILYHVAKTGPVVTVMKASDKFLYYSQGIFDDARCSRRQNDVDHAIVIVGYGSKDGTDYWIIKNSWGTTTWGQGGYGLYRRGKNACSIGHWGWVVTG